jgi:hypothetical protein
MGHNELPLFVHWEKTLGDLLDRTQKFPKSIRFTFSTRIDSLALDILEHIVESCYAPRSRKQTLLREMDGMLVRLRVLTRLCFERRYLNRQGYEHVARNLDEAGKMVGGWSRQQQQL